MKNKLIKVLASALLCVTLTMIAAFSCSAQESKTVTYTEDLGNGFTAVVTITDKTTVWARGMGSRSISKDYYHDGSFIGAAVLYGQFNYNGSSSSAISARGSGSGANGWTYSGQKVWTSGNGAYLNATLSKNGTYVPVSLSLHCDANGNVS